MQFLQTHFYTRVRALFNTGAWLLIFLGLLAFSVNIPLQSFGWVNLPVAATVFQTAGLVFMLCGFAIQASIIVWPQLNAGDLYRKVITENSNAAGLVLLGLLVFNAMVILAFTLWLSGALGAGVTAK